MAQASLKPLLFAHIKYGSKRRSDIQPHWMAVHACLKCEFTEDEKYHNLMRWLIYSL